ncbi:HYC_CC_PP family protein [Pontibacter akesuensis]|uniref:HYC_CC_PP family protein n=1 Tax=Pontibacter akesuensis TaxID=388950 RepID=UPI003F682C9F
MRYTHRHIAVLLLAFSVLLGSVGVALSETICRMAGTDTRIAASADACCSKPRQAEEKDSCCEKEVSYDKLEPVAAQKQHTLLVPVFFLTPLKPLLPQQIIAAEAKVYTYTDSSPPLHGRNLLHRIQVLIV